MTPGLPRAVAPDRNEATMTDRELYVPRIFSAYVQVRDLDRSLSFYQDTLGLEIECRDGALALLRSGGDSEHTLVIRQIGDHAVRRGGARPARRVFPGARRRPGIQLP